MADFVNGSFYFRTSIDSPTAKNGDMGNDRIREFREAEGWTQAQLAAAVGMGTTDVSKLETGKKQLRATEMQKIAAALDVDVGTLLGNEAQITARPQSGFADDLVPYVAEPSDPFAGLQSQNRHLYRATGNSLSKIGINHGDLLIVDVSAEAVKNIKPLAIVRVQHHPDPSRFGHAVSLLRQFVPPSLLITNSRERNELPLDIEADDAQIMGVVVSVHRALQA